MNWLDKFWHEWHRARRANRLAGLYYKRIKLVEQMESVDRLISYYVESLYQSHGDKSE